jgi:hypothetical protein
MPTTESKPILDLAGSGREMSGLHQALLLWPDAYAGYGGMGGTGSSLLGHYRSLAWHSHSIPLDAEALT